MRIGIGVTTFNRPECLEECLQHIYKYTDMLNVKLYVATDTNEDRRGVAFRKNECLRALKDCDYVFLFDDDCYPIKDGWIDFFIRENKYKLHLNFLSKKLHNYQNDIFNYEVYNDCGGCFMFLTKEHIKKVGAFNEEFKIYGFEHCEYSMRIANLQRQFLMMKGTEDYIYSHDYSTPNHKSSISDEEKNKCVKNNWNKFFNSGIKDVYLPL